MPKGNNSLEVIIEKCGKYDKAARDVESCFPKGISHIKRLYGLLRKCDDEGLCDHHGAGFAKSFFLAIEEANTRFESDLDDYISNVKHIEEKFHQDKNTGFLVNDIGAMESNFADKELYRHYKHYYDVLDEMQDLMVLKNDKLEAIDLDTIETVLDKFTESALALCLYVSSQPDGKDVFKGDCSEFKTKGR